MSGWGREKATNIMLVLQDQFKKISHPPFATLDRKRGLPDWFEEEKRAMQEPGRVYYSDDIVETACVCGLDNTVVSKPSLSTVEFLQWADETAEILGAQQVADALGHLVRLKVGGITVQQRYLVAAIPDELQVAKTVEAEKVAFLNAETLCSILDGIWDVSKSFDELINHFSQTMAYLLNKGNASEPVLIALWLRWMQSVRFQLEPARTPKWKISMAFISILHLLDDDKLKINRLWQSFWAAIKRSFVAEIEAPEDITGVRMIAIILGKERANEETEKLAGSLFEKAKLGLEAGTELQGQFDSSYISSLANEVSKQQ